METKDFILVCIRCYHSACKYMDDLQEAFDIELTEDDVREAVRTADVHNYHVGNALISSLYDKIVTKAQEAHPECANELPDLFEYYPADYASSLVFNKEQVSSWDSLEKEIKAWKHDKNKLPTTTEYQGYLQRACIKYGICIDEARERYGLFTVGQWDELLNRKTLFLEKRGMELRGKEAEFSDLQSYRLGIIEPIRAKDGKNVYGSFILWNYAEWCKNAKKQLNDNPPFAVCNDLCYNGDDGLCYRWITERQRAWNFDHDLSSDKIYPYTKAGLLAYVNDLVAAEPYDEIIIKDIQR